MAMTRDQILDGLADLGIEVSSDFKVCRKSVGAVLQWDPKGVQIFAEKLSRLGISSEPLKAPPRVEFSPQLYRELAIKQLKMKRPDVDWEAILPEVPAEDVAEAGPPDNCVVWRMPMTMTKEDYEKLDKTPDPNATESKKNKNEEDDFLAKKKSSPK